MPQAVSKDGLVAGLLAAGATRRPVSIAAVPLMLGATGALPTGPAWVFEPKYDGYRVLVGKEDGEPVIRYRRGSFGTSSWPELAASLRDLPFEDVILDAELTVSDGSRPSFGLVQQRFGVTGRAEAARAAEAHPGLLFCFDLLAVDGVDVRGLPLTDRKAALAALLRPFRVAVEFVPATDDGRALFGTARLSGAEGVMAKRRNSTYQGARTGDWIKVRHNATSDLVIVGYSVPGDRVPALHVGGYSGDQLVYAGIVKTGFPRGFVDAADALLRESRRPAPPCKGVATDVAETWVEPSVVAEVAFVEATSSGVLRHAEFVRLRPDKSPLDCVLPEGMGSGIEGRPIHRRRRR